YLPDSEEKTQKMAYIRCAENKKLGVGTSIYIENIEMSLDNLKSTFLTLFNTAVTPKSPYINLTQYVSLPNELSEIPLGKVEKRNSRRIAILKSNLFNLYYVYETNLTAALKESATYIYASLIILLTGLILSVKLRTEYEKHQIASDILKIISSEKINYPNYQQALDAVKKKVKIIFNEIKEKEFLENLTLNIGSKSTLSEVLQVFLDSYKDYKVRGVKIFVERDKYFAEILRKGEETKTAISHDDTVNGQVLRIMVYTSDDTNSNSVYIITKGISILSRKVADILRSMIDPLTGIWNRHYVHEFLDKEWKNFDISAIVMFDLDGFKEVNDKYGHAEGDRVLKEFVNRIKNAVRPEDILIRWGGDEFLLIIRNIKQRHICKTAERLRKIIEKPPLIKTIDVTVSAGVLIITRKTRGSFMKVLNMVDGILYEAKKSKNTVICKKA
ncbi:MAG: GGDEF domain-containing protein, partial [Thermotogaceae bacterium]|nr:GGDEF domain-containing protein [Thermotogaceae bacterium]